ncbi:NADH-quinone oxidoreductase subunit C [Glycomyces salinus]|uniref:NADH-quinone oxidoreductase subunit C n=1 Tax=Glycomyces salinus TaxID=980294 RepID=UPI0018EE09BA|nr:NADH-quinone oxidoreductase subunit C [Glycomyces salinus]
MAEDWLERVGAALGAEAAADAARAVAEVPAERWHESVRACRDRLGCDFFDWLSAVDESAIADGRGMRIVAHLWSIAERRGVLLKTHASGPLPSVTDLYPGAAWHERETHEMFGVGFTGHPGLDPLLLPPEFEGHPLRKDFVLASRVVKPWPGEKEPGGGRPGPRKRAPKRPPGVPEGWMDSADLQLASSPR